MGPEKIIKNSNNSAVFDVKDPLGICSSRQVSPDSPSTEISVGNSPQKNRLTKFAFWVAFYVGLMFVLDVVLFAGFGFLEGGLGTSILFALGASQLVSIVMWRTSDGWQMAKWSIALLGMVLFSLWLDQVMEAGWNQMWMVCCLLIVSGRLVWGLIETQRKRPADQVGFERFQASGQLRVRSFSIWNFLEWTVAAGLILSVVTLVYQNFLSSVLPMIGLLGFGFLCALSRLASTIVSENCQQSLRNEEKKGQGSLANFPFLDSAGTLFILVAVNVAGYFWMKRTLVHFYDQSLDMIFIIALVAQLWQLFDGLVENGFWKNLFESLKKSNMEMKVSASS